MNYVYGRSMVVMDSATDRMRLKDKIVANVAKAVKSIQELHVLSSSGAVKLGNYDWQCHRLCEHLDHSLLHGLRHVTPGYWKIVTEFTHKDCTKQIKRMRNVTTDLGRGRAWLLMALNECLLESYLRCYQQNNSMVEEFYVRDALVRDHDRFNVLLTVIAGLENTEFQMECDMPYLDLCVYPPKSSEHSSNVEATVDFDRMSICSMESVHLPTKHLPQTVFEDGKSSYKPAERTDTTSVGSEDFTHGHLRSPSPDSGIHSDWNFRQRSITPIDTHISHDPESDDGDDFKVIHLSKKGRPHKQKRRKKKFVSVSSISEPEVAEIHENHGGPVIEIPPIDDFKLSSAIMNNQNNNDSDNIGSESIVPSVRLPGDGVDSSETCHKQSATSRSNSVIGNDIGGATTRSASRLSVHNEMTKPSGAISPINANLKHDDLCGKGDTESSVNWNDRIAQNDGRHTPGHSNAHRELSSSKQDGGTFTQLLQARVSDIVKTGEQIEAKERLEEVNDKGNENDTESNPVFQYSKDNYGIVNEHKEIYSGDAITENGDGSNVPNVVLDSSKRVPVEPSIYSRAHDSDSANSDEDTESFSATMRQTFSRNSSTPSRQSERSGLSTNFSRDFRSTQSTPGLSKDLERNSGVASPFYESDSPFYGLPLSNRNTPDSFSANQNRSKSALSAANENERYRAGSKTSSNESAEFRGSPYSITDEERTIQHSLSSTQSPNQELEASGQQQVLQAKVEELIIQRKLNQYTHLTFGDEEMDIDDGVDGPGHVTPDLQRDRTSSLSAGEVELDNNTRLYLMLDILSGEGDNDESIIKMFYCRQGHAEGKPETVYTLISTSALYLLQRPMGKKKFSQIAAVHFTDIDFVSIGFNNQILHIACKTKRKQYWLTPGEERTTIAMVDCLADSMDKCESQPGRLEVDTGNTIQKISLQKYITSECRCEMEEADVVCYSLVHWEDPTSDTASCEWDREGTLYYKSQETASILGTPTWRLGHAVLKDGMLCLYTDKRDAKPTHFLSMGDGQCVGCKRDFNNDKNNAIKIILKDTSTWCIAMETEPEANNWLQALCQAVSEGHKMKASRASCVPCCMVLSRFKLLMCHEDLETNFIRTLGSANLHDVTAVLVDELNNMYIVLVFESDEDTVSSEKWVLYFNSDHECARFKTALAECWYKHFQVHVPELPLEDFSLQRSCTDMARHLKDTMTLH